MKAKNRPADPCTVRYNSVSESWEIVMHGKVLESGWHTNQEEVAVARARYLNTFWKKAGGHRLVKALKATKAALENWMEIAEENDKRKSDERALAMAEEAIKETEL